MDSEQLAELIINAAADFNAGILREVRERASPTADVVELAAPSRAPINNRWERQLRERLLACTLDEEKMRALFKRR